MSAGERDPWVMGISLSLGWGADSSAATVSASLEVVSDRAPSDARDPRQFDEGSQSVTHPPGTIRIGRVAGSDVLVSRSWFVIAAVIAYVSAPAIEQAEPGLGNLKYVGGFVVAVALYLSVLLHEISHAVMARRFGFPVSSITLHFLGGMTAIEGEARRPKEEFLIAVVGPITSLGVGVVALLAYQVGPDGLIGVVIWSLAFSNLAIGVMNLIPGLPLDGGRVLKAAIWGVTGNVHRGAIIAGWCGRILAVLVLFWPVYIRLFTDRRPSLLNLAFAVIIAGFLWSGASAAMSSARVRRRLPSLVARSLVRTSITVTEDTPLGEALRRAAEAGADGVITTTTSGTPVGIVSETAVSAMPEERRPWVPASAVARSIDPGLMLPAAISGEELILAISRRPANEYLLVEKDGSLVGVLFTSDVDRAFREARH